MNKINSFYRQIGFAVIAGSLSLGSFSSMAQKTDIAQNTDNETLDVLKKAPKIVPAPGAYVWADDTVPEPRWREHAYCRLFSPSQVHRFELLCRGATYLNTYVRDASFQPGDHWRVTAQANNAYESVAVTESGPDYWWGTPARVYNGYNYPTYLKAAVGCRYVADALNSPQLVTGWAEVAFLSDGFCFLIDHGTHFDEPDTL